MFCSTCLHLLWIIMTMEMPNNACLELTSLNSLLWHFLHMVCGCNLRRKSIFNISWCKLFIIFSVWCDSTIDIWNWCCTKWRGRKRVGWIMRLIFKQNISNYSIKLIVQFYFSRYNYSFIIELLPHLSWILARNFQSDADEDYCLLLALVLSWSLMLRIEQGHQTF